MKCTIVMILVFLPFSSFAQQRYNAALLDTLQQIAATNTPSKYFAQLYYQAIEITNKYAGKQPDSVKNFIFGFEASFAPEFFASYEAFTLGKQQVLCWRQYYADTSLNELQYKFMGMTAHINGDMWLALKGTYCYDTLRKYKRPLLKFQEALNTFFDSIYTTSGKYKRLNRLHFFTLGLDRAIGKAMVLHWRKNQVRMALLYYTNPERCIRRSKRLEHKMRRWNKFAVTWIK